MHRVLLTTLILITIDVVSTLAQEGPRPLVASPAVERELSGGQTHTYTLNLNADQIARVVAEQKGVDLVLSVFAPDGTRLFDVDSPNGASGEEPATIAARQSGQHRLEVRTLDTSAAAGRYAIRLDRFLTESEYLTERLAGLGKVWGAVRFFHPFLAYKAIDWDGALVKTIPHIKTARTPDEYRAAINGMLQTLGDPSTTTEVNVIDRNSSPRAGAGEEPSYFRVVNGYVVVRAIDWAMARVNANSAATAKQQQMLAEIGKAKGIVIDCRPIGVSPAPLLSFNLSSYLYSALPSFVQGVIPLGTERYRLHNGYPPQQGNTSGGYTSALLTQTPGAITGQAKEQKPLAVLIDERTPNLVPVLSGLQAKGARIVQVGNGNNGTGARMHRMLLPDGVRVTLRVADFVHPAGGSTFQPDVQITNDGGADDRALLATIAALNAPPTGQATAKAAPVEVMQGQKDDPYAQMSSPAEEYRLLALFRFWNVINYFYPYKHLTDQPWGTVLTDFIPRFLEAASALQYQRTVAEMAARMQDSHGSVRGLPDLEQHLGTFAPPVRLVSAGGKLVVGELVDAAAEATGIKLGDVIVAIDGEPTAQRVTALTKLKALSTPQSAYASIYPTALRGAKDSHVTLRVEGSDGSVRDVELSRAVPLGSIAGMQARKTPIYYVLPNGYGYVDLARLPLADAHKAIDAVLNTPAVVFDMRGYPNGTAWAIAPRLTDKTNVTAALFRRPLQAGTDFDDEDLGGRPPDYAFEQKLPTPQGAIYKGEVVMLINEFAISQSEHTCLFFESATSVTFVGSPTNGANGDVTNVVLPGNIYVNFSGHDVRHADGRQLQRVGIHPHIKVEPTPKGISERRDELLEAAVKYLDARLAK